MDFAALISLLRDLSPYVAIVLLICAMLGYYVYRRFNLKEKLLTFRQENAEKAAQTLILQKVNDINTGVVTAQTKLDNHITDYRTHRTTTVNVLQDIHRELIRMNSGAGKVISPDNAKKILLYQWNWCRDETARILINSIINNHYYGNEEATSKKVLNAWKDAAKAAHKSIIAIEGITYPVDPLFETQIKPIWARAWVLAVPVYKKFSGRPVEGRARFDELTIKVKDIFDQVYEAYIDAVEDIDNGLVYKPHDKETTDSFDDHALTSVRMAVQLKEADKPDPADDESTTGITPSEIIRRTVKQVLAEYKDKKKIRRTKSGLFEPQNLP